MGRRSDLQRAALFLLNRAGKESIRFRRKRAETVKERERGKPWRQKQPQFQ